MTSTIEPTVHGRAPTPAHDPPGRNSTPVLSTAAASEIHIADPAGTSDSWQRDWPGTGQRPVS